MKDGIYRNTCPRNCYGTCSILSYIKDDRLIKVTEDPKNGFTKGRLCAKGYAYTQYVYNPKRLKYPMAQISRGSGNWKRISWDEAYTIIAEKIIELNKRYGSNLALSYNKFSGNLGMLHYAVEGMFNSFGPHTKPVGNPCSLTGNLTVKKSFGHELSSIPEDMAKANLIVIWGANPAVTNVHQMKFIYEARRKGAKFVVIDPIFTKTAKKADVYIQINPGTDFLLACGVAKIIMEKEKGTNEFIQEQTPGWDPFKNFIKSNVDLEKVSKRTGAPIEAIELLAQYYLTLKPAATWCGLGIQRNEKGSNSITAIICLVAITGNLSTPFSGFYYTHFDIDKFPLNLLNHHGPVPPDIKASRDIDISQFAKNALALTNPPLKFLWIASRNIITQDQDLNAWRQLWKQLELIVTVDLYLTKTAKLSDLVLPVATHFEEEDLHVGYWHHWLSLNQKTVPPYYDAKSDLKIARELTRKLNEFAPGFSNFPYEKEPIDWIKEELTPEIKQLYSLTSYEDLLEGPRLKKSATHPQTLSRHFWVDAFNDLVRQKNEGTTETKPHSKKEAIYRLLTPQSLLKIHSQYEMMPWLNQEHAEDFIEISPKAARDHQIADDTKVEVFSEGGCIVGRAKINPSLPADVVLAAQAGSNPINKLITQRNGQTPNESSTFFYDSMVRIRKWREKHV